MATELMMTLKEADRLAVVKRIQNKELNIGSGARELGISSRQMKRVWRRFKERGARGLLSLKKGKPSPNKMPNVVRKKALRLVKKKYWDYGPTLASEKLESAITPKTKLITLMAVNNITGVKTDLHAIAAIAEKHQIPLVIDGVQLLGKEQFQIPRGISGMAFSSHKIHGPQGVGLALLRPHYKLPSLITGGSQENGRRGGTENIPGIVGFAKAVELLSTALPHATTHMQKLRDRLIEGISHAAGNIVVHGQGPRICNTAHIGFPGIDGETLLLQLDLAGVAASHGSACSSGGLEPSPILLQMGIPSKLAASSIRFSVSRFTTENEINQTLEIISSLLK